MDTRVYHDIEGLANFPTIELSKLSVFESYRLTHLGEFMV